MTTNFDKCDICGKETNSLVDYYCMICIDCKSKIIDIALLKKMSTILNNKVQNG